MIDLVNGVKGRQRLARCVVEASEASRNAAAGKTLRAGWFHVLWFWNPTGATASTRTDIARRTNPARIRLPQLSKQDPSKIDLPSAPISGFDPHLKSYEGFSHESLSALPSDLSVGSDSTHCPPLGITDHR